MPKIEYQQLTLRNAYLYEDCSFPLHRQGLVLIRGLNLDDGGFLGAGKSTLVDAWARVQFGKGGKQDTVADIVNPHVPRDLEIVLKLNVDGRPYEIRQYRNHHQHGTALQVIDMVSRENVLPLEFRTHPQVWIRDHLLRTDETSFFNTAYLTQSHTHILLHGKEAERRQRLTAMFGLDTYDAIAEQLHQLEKVHEGDLTYLEQSFSRLKEVKRLIGDSEDLSALKKKKEKIDLKLGEAKSRLEFSNDRLNTLQEELAGVRLRFNMETERAAAWAKSASLQKMIARPEDLSGKAAKKLQRRYEKLTSRKARLESRLASARERPILESQLATLDEDLELAGDIDQVERDLVTIKTRLHYLNTIELPQAEKRKELGQQIAKLGKVVGNLKDVREANTKAGQKVSELEQQIHRDSSKLEKGVCSECKRPLDMTDEEVAELRNALKNRRGELKRAKADHYNQQNLLKQLEQQDDLVTQLDAITSTRTVEEVDKEVATLVKRERHLSKLSELVKQKSVIEARLQGLPVLGPDETIERLKQLTEDLATTRTLARSSRRIADLNKKIAKLPLGEQAKLEKDVKRLRADVRSLTNLIGSRSLKTAKIAGKIGEVEKLQVELKELRQKVREGKDLRQRLACLSALRAAFGPKGIKQRRFHSILSDATENTIPVYSQLLWPSKQISLELEDNDGIKFYLKREGQKQLVHSNVLSGGEKHKAGLAFLLGLRDLKEIYSGSSFNVLVVDEPFGNLDPQGEQALLSILEMLKERFGSIFIISHRPEVIGSSVWDQTWWVIRKNHSSQLYTSDPPMRYLKMAETFMTTDGG